MRYARGARAPRTRSHRAYSTTNAKPRLSAVLRMAEPTCWLSQWGADGVGHQLFGMLTLLALDNVSMAGQRLRYACSASNVRRHFAHLTHRTSGPVQDYVQGSLNRFCSKHAPTPKSDIHGKIVRLPKEKYNRGWQPLPCSNGTVYVLDQALYSTLAVGLSTVRDELRRAFLPGLGSAPPRFAAPSGDPRSVRHAVIHVRLGDATNRGQNPHAHQLLAQLIQKLWQLADRQRNVLRIWIHTDSPHAREVREATEHGNVTVCDGKVCGASVLDALRDMAYADWLVTADSALSWFAAWINARASLIAAPSTTWHPAFATANRTCLPEGTLTYDELVGASQPPSESNS